MRSMLHAIRGYMPSTNRKKKYVSNVYSVEIPAQGQCESLSTKR